MINEVFVNGNRIVLSKLSFLAAGGEADVFDAGNGKALKIFKQPDHPDFNGIPALQRMAEDRIKLHQSKLNEFPKNVPSNVITPIHLATNNSGSVVYGYEMNMVSNSDVLYEYGQRSFHDKGIDNNLVLDIHRGMYHTTNALHSRSIVIGDYNDLNVLISGRNSYFIDADSFQFGKYFCSVFTTRFIDPLLCNPNGKVLEMVKPYNEYSDWYSFAILLFQSLLCVDPYGGVYADKSNKIPHDQRPLHRITVFNQSVKYPKHAFHYSLLPDDLLEYYHKLLEKDIRIVFQENLLEFTWQKCLNCGIEHGRNVCPVCVGAGIVKQKITINGNVIAHTDKIGDGVILFANFDGQSINHITHYNNVYYINHSKVIDGDLIPSIRYRMGGKKTYFARGNKIVMFNYLNQEKIIDVDTNGNLPIYDVNSNNVFWTYNGELLKNGEFDEPVRIGNVLQGQTQIWVGEDFGFGYYRAGTIPVYFVFSTEYLGINDSIKLDKIPGQIIDSTCFFHKDKCWFFVSYKYNGKNINRCVVINNAGNVLATAEEDAGSDSWLGYIRGKCAVSNALFSATDRGIVRLVISNKTIVEEAEFPSTEPFINSHSHLFVGNGGIYCVTQKEITHLIIK